MLETVPSHFHSSLLLAIGKLAPFFTGVKVNLRRVYSSILAKVWAWAIVVKCSWEYADLPRQFPNNSLCKIWDGNRVHYGQLENREFVKNSFHRMFLLQNLDLIVTDHLCAFWPIHCQIYWYSNDRLVRNGRVSAKAIRLNFSSNWACTVFSWVLSVTKKRKQNKGKLTIAEFFTSAIFSNISL